MFLEFYGLREQPFGVTPDPRFLYLSPIHREALASMYYGIEAGRGFLALIAKPGMGKTTLLFQLLEEFRNSARTAFLFQTQCDSREFIRFLLSELGIDTHENDRVKMHEQFNQVLLKELRAGKRFVVVVDEAQNLDDSVLETVRLLSNFETPRTKLMQIILAGQPELADKLARPNLQQLRQRVSLVNRLDPLAIPEIGRYIQHRLHIAGYKGGPLFSPEAQGAIAVRSEGIPRNINNLCFNALSLGYALGKRVIDKEIIDEVTSDLDLSKIISSPRQAFINLPEAPTFASSDFPTGIQPSATPIFAQPVSDFGWGGPSGNGHTNGNGNGNGNGHVATAAEQEAAAAKAMAEIFINEVATPVRAESTAHQAVMLDTLAPTGTDGGSVGKIEPALTFVSNTATSSNTATGTATAVAQSEAAAPATLASAATNFEERRAVSRPAPARRVAYVSSAKKSPASSNGTWQPQTLGTSLSVPPVKRTFWKNAIIAFFIIDLILGGIFLWYKETSDVTVRTPAASAPTSFQGDDSSTPEPQTVSADDDIASGRSGSGLPVRVSVPGSVFKSNLVHVVPPTVPEHAKQAGATGPVMLNAVIDRDGGVRSAKAVSGNPLLRQAAVDAVMQWRYRPYLVNGQPAEVDTQITVNFGQTQAQH